MLIIFENNSPSQFLVLKQPEVLFKGTPLEVFLTAWCVALNYTCKPLTANQSGVLHIDSSLHGGVSDTIPLIFLFIFFLLPLSLLSLPLRGVCD